LRLERFVQGLAVVSRLQHHRRTRRQEHAQRR
jgi:hypothetical protein